jgi:hypothetical protein
MRNLISFAVVIWIATGCLEQKPGTARLKDSPSTRVVAATISEDGQEVTGSLSASSGEIQILSAPEGSAISGVQSSFPPGAVSIDTEISLSPGPDIVASEDVSALGIGSDNKVESVGSSVSIESTVPFNTGVPFSVAIAVEGSSLSLQDGLLNFAVIFKAKDVDNNSLLFGVIPASEIRFVDGKAAFSTRYFGTYQLVKTQVPILARQESKVATLVADAPAEILEVSPFVADGGKQFTIKGKGFTGKMIVTVAGLTVRQLNVKSDVQASFIVPSDVPFGFTEVGAEQAGVKSTYPLLARSSDKLSLPLITMEPSGVCSGVSYYDANGVQQKGTKACESSTASKAMSADYATQAGQAEYATEAGFARGKKGSNITAGASVSIPADGDYFELSGSTTIKDFGVGSKGQTVTIEFKSEVLVVGNEKLELSDGGFVAENGTLIVLAGTGTGWREQHRSKKKQSAGFVGVLGLNGSSQDFSSYTESSMVPFGFDEVRVDTAQFTYDAASKTITPKQTRYYQVDMGVYMDKPNADGSVYCAIGMTAGSGMWPSISGWSNSSPNCYNTSTSGSPVMLYSTSTYSFVYSMYWSGSFGTPPTGTFKFRSTPKAATYIKLIPQ